MLKDTLDRINGQVQAACKNVERSEHFLYLWKEAFLEVASYEIPNTLVGKLHRLIRVECASQQLYTEENDEEAYEHSEEQRIRQALDLCKQFIVSDIQPEEADMSMPQLRKHLNTEREKYRDLYERYKIELEKR